MEELKGQLTTIIKNGTRGFRDGYNHHPRNDLKQPSHTTPPLIAPTITTILSSPDT